MLSAIIATTLLIGQQICIQQPIYVTIRIPEGIKTRTDITAILPDGTRFYAPIVNGYQPTITVSRKNGITYRVFTYEDRIKWDGNFVKKFDKVQKPTLTIKRTLIRVNLKIRKSLPSSIKSKEANFTKKFPRYK